MIEGTFLTTLSLNEARKQAGRWQRGGLADAGLEESVLMCHESRAKTFAVKA
jgi:hypothetical protein